MKNVRLPIGQNFLAEQKGGVAVIFALAALPMALAVGAAVDYQQAVNARDKLQNATDAAALSLASSLGSYYKANNGAVAPSETITTYEQNASNMVTAQAAAVKNLSPTAYACPLAGPTCTWKNAAGVVIETLQPGQAQVSASGIQPRIFSNVSTAASVNLGATSIASVTGTSHTTTTPAPSPATINYQFQYAKGWYYKVVTLWAVPAVTNSNPTPTPTNVAQWTYQATNLAQIAYHAANVTLPGFPSHPSDTGIGIVTTVYNPNTSVASDGTINLTTSHDSTGEYSLANYSNLYLTMQVEDGECAPGMAYQALPYTTTTGSGWNQVTTTHPAVAPTAAQQAFYAKYYSGFTPSSMTTTVQCTGTASSNFTKTMSTNSTTNSNYIYVNGNEEPNNTQINVGSAFPCPANPTAGQTATNYYEWEDSDTSTSGDRDFFFSLTTTCSAGNWSGAATTTTTTYTTTPASLTH